jgi:hypothetical protein
MSQIKAVINRPMCFTKGEIDQRDRNSRAMLKLAVPYVGAPYVPAEVPWEQRACKGMNTALFFSAGTPNPAAVAACKRCPVREPCLTRTLAHEEGVCYSFGYAGGMGATARQEIVSARFQTRVIAEADEAVRLVRAGMSIKAAALQTGAAWATVKKRLTASA